MEMPKPVPSPVAVPPKSDPPKADPWAGFPIVDPPSDGWPFCVSGVPRPKAEGCAPCGAEVDPNPEPNTPPPGLPPSPVPRPVFGIEDADNPNPPDEEDIP